MPHENRRKLGGIGMVVVTQHLNALAVHAVQQALKKGTASLCRYTKGVGLRVHSSSRQHHSHAAGHGRFRKL